MVSSCRNSGTISQELRYQFTGTAVQFRQDSSGSGNVSRNGNAAWRHYGKSPETLLGESFERLDETYWGNSTLPDVYRTHKTVAKRQITNLGLDIVTISVSIFDDEGNLKYVAMNVNDIYNYIQDGEVEREFLRIMQSNDTDRMDDSIIYSGHKMKEALGLSQSRAYRLIKKYCL